MIEFDHITKRFPDGTVAVDDLDLVVEEGSLTVFVGPSGCGKTTSMRMINRMIDPTTGTIRVGGQDVTTVSPVSLRRRIGYVIQNAGVLPHRTVVDNVATVPLLRGESRRTARRKALNAMERVGLSLSLAKRFPAQLSGGQQQRVGVARALAADPEVLLMDEPFSAVDPVVREELQNELRRLQTDLRKTIVFVTHDMDEAMLLGDKVAVFGTGGVLQQYATPAVVLARPATPFVATLVGRDRGYRSLSFRSGQTLPVRAITGVRLEEAAVANVDGWTLIVDDAGSAVGWMDSDGQRKFRAGVHPDSTFAPVGSVMSPSGSLRQALDAALSSPSGLGVVADGAGAAVGVVCAEDVIACLAEQRREHAVQDAIGGP